MTSALAAPETGPVAATPGSYGEAPRGCRLPDATRVGGVRIQIADLTRSLHFYEQVLGLRILDRTSAGATLGAYGEERVLVELVEHRHTLPVRRGRLGLYHFAILLPDRSALGRFVRHLAESGVQFGAGDHLVSEAFYLSDPDGLGIEVYADRLRDTWQRVGRELLMATDPVDVRGLVDAAGPTPWTGMPSGTVMGHVHLHVGDIARASAFYADALGFDRTTWSYPGALFFAAGGYHHHLGTNTWAGPGARAPEPNEAKLLEWTIDVPTADDVAAVTASVTRGGYPVRTGAAGALVTQDPWGTVVQVRVASHLASTPSQHST